MADLVFVQFIPKSGQEASVEKILRGMVISTRKKPGNLRYDLFRSSSSNGRTQYNLLEQYVDDTTAKFHRETENYKKYRIDIMPLLSEPIAVTLMDALYQLSVIVTDHRTLNRRAGFSETLGFAPTMARARNAPTKSR